MDLHPCPVGGCPDHLVLWRGGVAPSFCGLLCGHAPSLEVELGDAASQGRPRLTTQRRLGRKEEAARQSQDQSHRLLRHGLVYQFNDVPTIQLTVFILRNCFRFRQIQAVKPIF